jgi:hypothetical protein
VTYRLRDLGMQYPGVRHIHVKLSCLLFFLFCLYGSGTWSLKLRVFTVFVKKLLKKQLVGRGVCVGQFYKLQLYNLFFSITLLILILLTCKIRWPLNNASKWQMEFNLAFKGLRQFERMRLTEPAGRKEMWEVPANVWSENQKNTQPLGTVQYTMIVGQITW